MPILTTDIDYKHSGGGANSDGNASIGGAISSVDVGNALHDLFDIVSSDEASSGDAEYRCFYIQNNHASLVAQNGKIWIQSNSSGVDTDLAIGIGAAAVDAAEPAIANEGAVPAGVVFTQPADKANGLTISNLNAGSYQAVWVRRVVNANSSAINNDSATIRVSIDTAA